MLDAEAVSERLSRLEHYAARRKEVAVHTRDEYLASEDLQDIAERNLQLAIECLIDIGSHIVSSRALGRPASYGEIFKALATAGIYPASFGDRLASMAAFRNLLVHDYLSKDPSRIYDHLKLVDDFVGFAGYVEPLLER